MEEAQLTPTSYIVLGLLERLRGGTPYDLKRTVASSIGNFWSVPHSQLYAEPERLAKGGYMKVRREQGGRRRKHYALTARGRKALAEWLESPTAELYELRDPGLLKLAFGSDAKSLAAAQLPVHEERLRHFQDILRVLEASGAPVEQRLVVESGIGHEREYVRFWKRVAGG
jgi:DNA-binding PadR family transcriptional regulator